MRERALRGDRGNGRQSSEERIARVPGENGRNALAPDQPTAGMPSRNGHGENGNGSLAPDQPTADMPSLNGHGEHRPWLVDGIVPLPVPTPPPAHAGEMEPHVRALLEMLGEDPSRDGLQRTPQRVAQALRWLTRGYQMDAASIIEKAVFEEQHESMVLVRDIELYSLCEHHMLPFFGRAHIAYIPDGRIVGLSKVPRIVEVFARRLQVQERLTDQIADAIQEALRPRGVGVVIEASHLCMMMRGVEKQNSRTVTSALRGEFRTCPMTRDEFLRLVQSRS